MESTDSDDRVLFHLLNEDGERMRTDEWMAIGYESFTMSRDVRRYIRTMPDPFDMIILSDELDEDDLSKVAKSMIADALTPYGSNRRIQMICDTVMSAKSQSDLNGRTIISVEDPNV